MANKPAIIFDCFGVLYSNSLGEFYSRHPDFVEGNADALAEITSQLNLGEIALAESYRLYQRLGLDMPAEDIRTEIWNNLILDRNLLELIKKLKQTHLIGIISNAGEEEIGIIYRDKIDDLFDAVTVSYEVGVQKPDGAIYRTAAKRLGTQVGSCAVVDDNPANVEGAIRVGMHGILYPEYGIVPGELSALVNDVLT